MTRLAYPEVERMLGQMQAAARPGSDWAGRWGKWQGAYGDRLAWVEFPLGELMNPAIAGFVWAWAMQKRLVVGSIQEGDQFNAQAWRGKCACTPLYPRPCWFIGTYPLIAARWLWRGRCGMAVGTAISAGDGTCAKQARLRRLRRSLVKSLWDDVLEGGPGYRSEETRQLAAEATGLSTELRETSGKKSVNSGPKTPGLAKKEKRCPAVSTIQAE